MTTFEYVAVLVSIIVGISLTHLLSGAGRLIGPPGRTKVYWVHLTWSAYAFLYLVSFWWWEFQLSTIEIWTVQLYLFLILYATLLYLVCVVLYPRETPADFREHFHLRRKWFFGVWILIFLVDIVDTSFKGSDRLVSLGLEYWATIVVFIALFLVAMATRSERFHGAFAVGAFGFQVYQLTWIPLFGPGP